MISGLLVIVLQLFSIVVFAYIILGYFVSPYDSIMEFLRRIIEPMLAPIRKVIPPIGGLDFSPVVLIIIIQLIGKLLVLLLANMGL